MNANATALRTGSGYVVWGTSCLGVALLIAFVLFPVDLWRMAPGTLASVMATIDAALSASEYQTVVALAGFVYFAALLGVRSRLRRSARLSQPGLWLAVCLVIATLDYATNDSPTRMFVAWLGAMLAAYAIAIWVQLRPKPLVHAYVIALFLLLLGTAAMTSHAGQFLHKYRGHLRWSGPWDNPNICGLLMSVGVVLAGGMLLTLSRDRAQKRPSTRWSGRAVAVALTAIVGVLLLRGLLLTYSRGAWLGAAIAFAYLLAQHSTLRSSTMAKTAIAWLRARWLPCAVIAVSAITLACWHLADTRLTMVRRALSVANTADLSWQNRLSAWKGTLQLMAENPWRGVGWNHAEAMYTQFYLPPRLVEGAAIQTNDYLVIGATLGIPALAAFAAYIFFALARHRHEIAGGAGTTDVASVREDLKLVCRAAALVLVVGFALDGALFKWSAAATFAVLLELGSQRAA